MTSKEYAPFMSADSQPRQLGGQVPNFELAVYHPVKNEALSK